ncbi:unnamed protein product [Diamesa hyperborea]
MESKLTKTRGSYANNCSPTNIADAIRHVRTGCSIYKASKLFKIPYQTLWDSFRNKHPGKKAGNIIILFKEEEEQLAYYIIDKAKRGMPRSNKQILETVKEISMISSGK